MIAQRFHFHCRDQAVGESIAEYVAELRRLSTHCEFGAFLNEALRDRLVCGLRYEGIQRRLLSESKLTLTKALELAQGLEAADRHAKALKGSEVAVRKLSATPSKRPQHTMCYRCGRSNHKPKDCRFRGAECHNCGKKGHIAPACRATKKSKPAGGRKSDRKWQPKSAKWVDADGDDLVSPSDQEDLKLFTIGKKSSRPIIVTLQVNGKALSMEVDTGAAVSLISEDTLKKVLPDAIPRKSNVVLRTYTEERMTVLGELLVDVQYSNQRKSLELIVIAGAGTSLLGRNWLQHLRLDWQNIFSVRVEDDRTGRLQAAFKQYEEIFREELGTVRGINATLQVRPEAVQKFCKARPVPFAIKAAVDQELDRLESSGILEPVKHSKWAAPIVVVPKRDGKFRVCGDYKVTVNQALEVDQYPLPKPEDLFATLTGGKKFTKLDLSQAYQQVLLDEKSRDYVVINTHRGLYRYNRLPFGVASAPAIFQKVMDTILQGIPHVICYIDDILVTGKDDAEHLSNLEEVIERLQHYGLRTKRAKCAFLQTSVDYLGHRIDADGLHTTTDKLEAITKVPTPRNVQELRSFLGLLNYYGKFMPN